LRTPIGIGRGRPGEPGPPGVSPATGAAAALALAAVGADLWLAARGAGYVTRSSAAGAAVLALVLLSRGGTDALGLVARPRQGARYWLLFALGTGAALALVLLAAAGVRIALGGEPPPLGLAPSELGPRFVHACLLAPVVEEAVYRLVACPPAATLLGPWLAVAASGAPFAALHVAYGNASPENVLGGFVLAWSFLKSGSVLVPWALHASGNLAVLLLHAAAGWATGLAT